MCPVTGPIRLALSFANKVFFGSVYSKREDFQRKDVFLSFLTTFCPCVITVWDSGTLIAVNALLNKVYPSFFAWDTLGTIGTVMLEVPPCQ